MRNPSRLGLWSLLPFGVFMGVFLGTGIYYDNFYALPSPIAISAGIIVAFLMFRGTAQEKTTTFLKGCGDNTILKMCTIYLLAGAFATVAEAIGSTDAIVQLGIQNLPPTYFPAGIFLIAAFLSIASGTSVGTIVALGPIVVGIAQTGGLDINLLGACLLGGALFGDNLSIISDTTIAATQIMGCRMNEKFKNNILFALPAAVITFLIYMTIGVDQSAVAQHTSQALQWQSLLLILPYIVVIVLAFAGLDVFVVLLIGILLSGLLGLVGQGFSLLELGQQVYEGFTGMTEIFLLSLFTGGLAAMVEKAGGIDHLLTLIKRKISGRKSALFGVGAFVGITDSAIANNTISILISGKIAQRITDDYHIKPRAMASILDTFSCIAQGMIPYGAQILILTGYSDNSIDYLALISQNYYLMILLLAVSVYIVFGKTKETRKTQNIAA